MSITPLDLLSSIIPLSNELQLRLNSILSVAEYRKKEVLLREGQVCNRIYFIESGLIRIYYLKDGREICSGMLFEGGIVIAVKSFFRRQPSDEFIETIENTRVQSISYEEL